MLLIMCIVAILAFSLGFAIGIYVGDMKDR